MGRRATDKVTYRYLASLEDKSEAHKKRFAFGVSGMVTLAIFSFWIMARTGNEVLATEEVPGAQVATSEEFVASGVTPFQTFSSGLASSFNALQGVFVAIKSEAGKIDTEAINAEYEAVKKDAVR